MNWHFNFSGPVTITGLSDQQVSALMARFDSLPTKTDLETIMSTAQNALDQQIAELRADVAAETTVEGSAITLITGIPALIQAAVEKALAAGATPAQLAALNALGSSITTSASALSAAVTANTPLSSADQA